MFNFYSHAETFYGVPASQRHIRTFMNRILLFLAIGLTSVVFTGHSQPLPETQKIGHANSDYILSQMPQFKQIQSELQTYEAQLQAQLKAKNTEFETKYNAYRTLSPTTLETIRKDKETELTYLQESLQKFQQDAQVLMQKKQSDLVTPIFEKIGKAIKEVALENGYTYIMNPQNAGGGDSFFYADEKYNISDLVLKKLGITPKPTAPAK